MGVEPVQLGGVRKAEMTEAEENRIVNSHKTAGGE